MPETPDLLKKFERFLDGLLAVARPRPLFSRKPVPRSPQGLAYASFNQRALALILDSCVLMLLFTPFNDMLLTYVYRDLNLEPLLAQTQAGTPISPMQVRESGLGQAVLLLAEIQFVAFCIYSFVFWHFYNATPGKLLLRLSLVDAETGAPLKFSQMLLRLLGYALIAVTLGIGLIGLNNRPRRQGWHDRLAHSAVVVLKRSKSAPEAADPSDSPAPETAE